MTDEVDPSCWEDSFSVLEPEAALGPEGMFSVMEAECEVVGYFRSRRAADVVAEALNRAWGGNGHWPPSWVTQELPVSQTGAGEDASQATPPAAAGASACVPAPETKAMLRRFSQDDRSPGVFVEIPAMPHHLGWPRESARDMRCQAHRRVTVARLHELPGVGVGVAWPVDLACEMPDGHDGQHFSTVPAGFLESGQEYTWP